MRQEQTGTFTLQTTAKGQLYRRTVLGDAVEERGFDGSNGWQLQSGILVLDDATAAAVTKEDAVLHWYFNLEARGITQTIEPVRTADFAGQATTLDGIRWKNANPAIPDKTMWFDRSTGFLREELVEEATETGLKLQQWVLYDDYQAVDGVMIPHSIRLVSELGERAQEVIFTAQRVDHSAIDSSIFAVPQLAKPEPATDELLVALAASEAAYRANPKELTDVVAYARHLWAAAHFDRAAEIAKAALKLDSKEIEALWILARAQVLQGQWKNASKTLSRAAKAGVRPELVATQRAWIASHTRDFVGVAKALEATGPNQKTLVARYRSFAGKPLVTKHEGDGCTSLVPLSQAMTSLPLVEIEVGGIEVMAMIDTGATDVILDEELAAQLKVPIRSRTPVNQQGDTIGHGQLESLTIGDITVKSVPVDIFSVATIAAMSGSSSKVARAVLGVRFLELFQISVDPEAATLTLVDSSSPKMEKKCRKALTKQRQGKSSPFWVHETHFIYVPAKLNGAEGLFLLNTGMQGVDLAATTSAYKRSAIGAPPLRRGEAAIVRVEELRMGDYLANNLAAAYGYFEQSKSTDDFRIDGMIGLGVFQKGRWTLDFAERRIYLEAPTTAPQDGATTPAKAAPK
ncbi:MAG TPA: hypothetical protein ENJ18_12600 [Nannocystis exedens]|nr:hypothetical protein [Nannocystis exedens]